MTAKDMVGRATRVERWSPRSDRELWADYVRQALPRVGITNREADLSERRRQARLLAIAALRAAGEDELVDILERAPEMHQAMPLR